MERGLQIMGDLFASAAGTTVLQIKEIPPRPASYDGIVRLFGCQEGIDEAAIQNMLASFGRIISCEFDGADATVRFTTHAAALTVKQASEEFAHVFAGVDTQYIERSYDGREGEPGRADDLGRGWCTFEGLVCGELISHLDRYPMMRLILKTLPPKLLALASEQPSEAMDELGMRAGSVEENLERLEGAAFTVCADRPIVIAAYQAYVAGVAERVATALADERRSTPGEESGAAPTSMPEVDLPQEQALRLAPGQVLLMRGKDSWQFGVVEDVDDDASVQEEEASEEACLMLPLANTVAELSFDECHQAVLPWRPTDGSEGDVLGELVRNVYALRNLTEGGVLTKDAQQVTMEEVRAIEQGFGALRMVRSHEAVVAVLESAQAAMAAITHLSDATASHTKAVEMRNHALTESDRASAKLNSAPKQRSLAEAACDAAKAERIRALEGRAGKERIHRDWIQKRDGARAKHDGAVAAHESARVDYTNATAAHSHARVECDSAGAEFNRAKEVHQAAVLERSRAEAAHDRAKAANERAKQQHVTPMTERTQAGAAETATVRVVLGIAEPGRAVATGEVVAEEVATVALRVVALHRQAKSDGHLNEVDEAVATGEEEVASASAEMDAAAKALSDAKQREAQTADSMAAAEKTSLGAHGEVAKAEEAAASLMEVVEKASAEASNMKEELALTQEGLAKAEGELASVAEEAAKADIEVGQAETAVREANSEIRAAKRKVALTEENVAKAGQAVAEAEQELSKAKDGCGSSLPTLQNAVAELNLEAIATSTLVSSGLCGVRRYAKGQWLTVRRARGGWEDVEVAGDGVVRLMGEVIKLHPWNHAPRELPAPAFEALRKWHVVQLRAQHGHIVDAASGAHLDSLEQCVAMDVMGDAPALPSDANTRNLSEWLREQHAKRVLGSERDTPCATLLTAPAGAGKSTLISQLTMLSLGGELVPIVINIQSLQRRLLSEPGAFAASWNYVDAYLCLEHESALYCCLRQVLVARRALLLLDGLDEGGQKRDEIEKHVVEVLAPQGHALLATSRPTGVDLEGRFGAFYHLKLLALTDARQAQAIKQRVGEDSAAKLLPYVRARVPIDAETGSRLTANPLVLSIIVSIFDQCAGKPMPSALLELYAVATDAMLSRGGPVTQHVKQLLQRVCFEAHATQRRVIDDCQLDEAALMLEAPDSLEAIRKRALQEPLSLEEPPLPPYEGPLELGQYVEVTQGKHTGKRGFIHAVKKTLGFCKVKFVDGELSGYLKFGDLTSFGLDEAQLLEHATLASAADVLSACEGLSEPMCEALRTVRERIARDELPLFRLLQACPQHVQSSHISFQEYLAARTLADEDVVLLGPSPWQWAAWWFNTVELGTQMGDAFTRGLLRASGATSDTLDLSQKLGGHRPTVLRVVSLFTAAFTTLDLSDNLLLAEGAQAIADALVSGSILTKLNLSDNELGPEGGRAIAEALKHQQSVLTSLSLFNNSIGQGGAEALADALQSNIVLTSLDLGANQLDAQAGKQLAEALLVNTSLRLLNLDRNCLGAEGASAIAELIKSGQGPLAAISIADNQLCVMQSHGQHIYNDSGIKAIASSLADSKFLTSLNVRKNDLDAHAAKAFAKALAANATVNQFQLDMRSNRIGDKDEPAVRECVKGHKWFALLV